MTHFDNRDGEMVELTAEEIAALYPETRRLLPKSKVTARLIALGKAADVKAAFDADPEAFFRWVAPDWPNVYADDTGLLAFLAALGLTEEQIAGVVAP
jgi:hypothetical protein